jgi:Tol biopolymer transport system component
VALPEGTRLGPYEIAAPLGAGGMGEVYRARDTRLDRTVALKILSPALAASPELEARFEREARAIAALQHPHICVLFDLGREGATAYLVMEYLEGETLGARLRRGPLPLSEIVRLGAQIAEALDAAHRAGIVHRDLKPANVMLTREGAQSQAKLLDFGLAKPGLASARPASAPTFTATLAPTELASPATQAGVVMGTVQYMSPEQIEGREVDARSDVFALGCVLYEMAAGKPAFEGKSSLSVASAILEKDPPPVAPAALDRVIQLCLAKAPEERLQSARDAALLLREVKLDAPAAETQAGPAAARRGWLFALVGAAAGALAVAGALWLRPRATGTRMISDLPAPAGVTFNFSGSAPGPPAISPGGGMVVFAAHAQGRQRQLWLRRLGQAQAQPLAGTADAVFPFWSPDGNAIGFFASRSAERRGNGRLMIYSLKSGQVRALANAFLARGGTWGADGTIVFAPDVAGGLQRIAASGGAATPLPISQTAEYTSLRYPYFLPGGKNILYLAVSHTDANHDQIYFASLDGKVNRPLMHATTGGVYATAGGKGYLLYSASGTLMAQPMQPDGTLMGAAQPVAHGVFEDGITWRPAFSASRTGDLAFAAGAMGDQQLVWLNRAGKITGTLPPFPGNAVTAAISPGGRRLAVSIDNGQQDIWVVRLSDGTSSRFTFGPIGNLFPVWSPHGKWIAYADEVGIDQHILRRRASGNGVAQVIGAAREGPSAYPVAWTRDGRELVVAGGGNGNRAALGIFALPLAGGGVRVIVPPNHRATQLPQLSPDGRWISYATGPAGQLPELFVAPFGGGGGKWQVTTQGVENYFWADGGKEMDVIDGQGTLEAIPVNVSAGAPVFGPPRTLAQRFPRVLAAAAGGQRFLAITYPNDHQRLVYVRNWAAALH